jgi:predicted dehydrogenase
VATQPLPTLVIGYGNMGSKHARVLRELGGVESVWGVVDPSEERRRKAVFDNPAARPYATLGEALGAISPEARPACATVAASTPLHFELVRELLARRIPTLVEKPIAATAEQGRALLELAGRTSTVLTVGHVERFNPAAVAARKLVADRVIGDVIQLCFRRVGGTPADATTNHQDVLVDLAVHDYDLVRFITGATLQVTEALGHRDGARLDSALVLGHLSNGASMHLQVNWRTPVKIRRIELTGTSGYAEINLITQQVTLYRQNPLLTSPSATLDPNPYFDSYLLSFASPDRVELGIERREPLLEELAAFWRAVGQGAPSPVPAADAVAAVELTEVTRRLLERHRGPA